MLRYLFTNLLSFIFHLSLFLITLTLYLIDFKNRLFQWSACIFGSRTVFIYLKITFKIIESWAPMLISSLPSLTVACYSFCKCDGDSFYLSFCVVALLSNSIERQAILKLFLNFLHLYTPYKKQTKLKRNNEKEGPRSSFSCHKASVFSLWQRQRH